MRDKLGRFIKGHIPWHKGTHVQLNTGRTHFKKGQAPYNWKGGKRKSNGRWFILKSNHPFASTEHYVPRYRLVAEKCLGRYLTPKEVIHHINRKKDDDRPKNLYLFPSNSAHTTYEGLKNKPELTSNLTQSP